MDLSPGTATRPATRAAGRTVAASAGARNITRTIAFDSLETGSRPPAGPEVRRKATSPPVDLLNEIGLVCYSLACISSPLTFHTVRCQAAIVAASPLHVDP